MLDDIESRRFDRLCGSSRRGCTYIIFSSSLSGYDSRVVVCVCYLFDSRYWEVEGFDASLLQIVNYFKNLDCEGELSLSPEKMIHTMQ